MTLKSEDLYADAVGIPHTDFAEKLYAELLEHHGTAYSHFNGDECLSSNSPVQGSELCGIVEAMYGYEQPIASTERSIWGDHLEDLAFNGLPATFSADMWTHQYDQNEAYLKKIRHFCGGPFR